MSPVPAPRAKTILRSTKVTGHADSAHPAGPAIVTTRTGSAARQARRRSQSWWRDPPTRIAPRTVGQRPPRLHSPGSNTPQQVKLIAPGTYNGAGGGTAVVTESTNATTGHIIRTVQYTNYVNDEGMILNGFETTDQSAAQN